MESKEIRRRILEAIYNSEDRDFFTLDSFKHQRALIGDNALNKEIRYLEGNGYLIIKDRTLDGSSEINYSVLGITSKGVDFVENPDILDHRTSVEINHFENISSSNVSIKSPFSTQSITNSDITPEIQSLLIQLIENLEKKDKENSLKLLNEIGTISKDILIGVVSNGIYSFLKNNGIEL